MTTDDLPSTRTALQDWIAARCIFTSDRELLLNSRGERQAWMLDLRPALLDGRAAGLIAELFWGRMAQHWPFQLAAQELAGVPLLAALLTKGAQLGFEASGVVIRKERKQHGRQRTIEGDLTALPVVLVDDVVNSGGSVAKALAVLAALEARTPWVFSVIDFGSPAARARLEAEGVASESLFGLVDFGLDLQFPKGQRAEAPPLTIRWSFTPKRRPYGYVARKAAPVVAFGMVYHATEAGWLHALDLQTGEVRWERQLARRSKGLWSTPAVTADAVYIGSYDGVVFRLDRVGGAEVWRFEGADWVGSSPCLNAAGDRLYIGLEYALGGGTGAVAALDTATGELIWRAETPAVVHASPVVLPHGVVVCGANDGRLRALDARSGEAVWETDLGGDIKAAATTGPRGQRLFAGSCDAAVYAVEAADGRIAWRQETEGEVYAPPLLVEGFLYAASTDGAVYKFGAGQGRRLARRQIGGKLFAAPVRDGDTLLVGSTNGQLARLRLDDLSIVSLHAFEERITSEVAVSRLGPLVSTFDGQLFAVDAATSAR